MRGFKFESCAFDLFFQMRRTLHRRLFRDPDFFQIRELLLQVAKFGLKIIEALLRRIV